jgi:archaellum biogenesis ATPase FlaH
MNTQFLKEVITKIDNNSSLIIINQKQFEESIKFFLIENLKKENNIILIANTKTSINEFLKNQNEKLFLIDCFSKEKVAEKNYFNIGDCSNLTKIQITLNKIIKDNTIVIFDSLSVTSIYNKPTNVGRFIYFLNNKIKFQKSSIAYFVINETIEEEILLFSKELCDENYDFSKLLLDSID